MEQQDAARSKAVAAAIALAVARTRAFTEWYSTVSITAWAISLARDIEVIQRNLARQTDVFLSKQASVASGRPVRPVGAVQVADLRQGITHAGAYGRIADVYRYQEARLKAPTPAADPSGVRLPSRQADFEARRKELQSALDAAIARAEDIAEMDTQLAVRAQANKFMLAQPAADEQPARQAGTDGSPEAQPDPEQIQPKGRPRLVGWRRMVHPELSRNGSCGMCLVASTRLYYRADLMPIHTGCNCVPLPIYEGSDAAYLVNEEDLARFYDEAGSNRREDLKNTRYQINQHGELGPVLNRHGVPFRTPGQVARDEQRDN